MKAPVLESERLLLEPLSSAFLSEHYVSWLNDPEVNRYLDSPADSTLEDLREYLANVDCNDILFWAIRTKPDSRHIGNIKIDPVNLRHKTAEYGILIGDRTAWGQGFAREASECVAHYCFEELGLRKITLGVVADNTAAVKLYEKMGFVTEGRYKAQGFYGQRWCDVLRMALFNPALAQ